MFAQCRRLCWNIKLCTGSLLTVWLCELKMLCVVKIFVSLLSGHDLYIETFRAFHGEYYGYILGRFTVNNLDTVFLVAVENITDVFSGVSPSVISSLCLMTHLKWFQYFVGYLTVNFLDDLSCVSPSDIPIFCLPSDGGYYLGHLTVKMHILCLVSEGPRWNFSIFGGLLTVKWPVVLSALGSDSPRNHVVSLTVNYQVKSLYNLSQISR
jgi:hypothetical protein